MTENMQSIEQDIVRLEQQIQEKRAKLEESGVAPEQQPSDKDLLHEAVGEQIKQQIPEYQPAQPSVKSEDQPSYLNPELKDQVQELVNMVFRNGSLDKAIETAEKTKNPALLDALHDVLVDELYPQLLEHKKVQAVQ